MFQFSESSIWLFPIISVFLIITYFLYLYLKDRDKRKLMFSISFIMASMDYILLFTEYPIKENLILHNLYLIAAFPLQIAILITVIDILYDIKNFNKTFNGFIVSIILLVVLTFLIPFSIKKLLLPIRVILAIDTIGISIYSFIKIRKYNVLIFSLALISFSVASIGVSNNLIELAVFSYIIAYIFIAMVFIESSIGDKGIDSYFSLKKKLEYTEEALRKSEEKYRIIVENTSDVVMLTKPDGIIYYISPSCENVLGYPVEDLVGKQPWIIHPDDLDRVKQIHYQALNGSEGSNYEYRIVTKDGVTKWVSHSWSPVYRDGKLKFIVSIIRDITENKKMEERLNTKIKELEQAEIASLNIMEDLQDTIEELKKTKEELEEKNRELQDKMEEIQMMNEELNVVREQLTILNKTLEDKVKERTKEIEKLLQQKDEFINQLGHDLKTPLTPIITLLPIIRKRIDDPKTLELLDTVIQSSLYMKDLVTKTLQLARLNSPNMKFHVEETNLLEEINRVIERNETVFQEHNIEVENLVDDDILVRVDKLRLNELLDNLISNAVKYSPSGGRIKIRAEKEENEVKVSIQDEGIGMSREQLNHIFDEFYKADPSRHDFESSGLGLPICKKIVEKHGGRIWVESPGLGKGSTFYFTLPSAKQ